MIKSFKHKGIEEFFYTGNKKGIRPEHAGRLEIILDRLNAANEVKDMNYLPVDKVTWAIEWGCVKDKVLNKPFVWIVDKQIVPMDIRLKKVFRSNEYKNYVNKQKKNYNFEFNEELYEQCKRNKSRKEMENIV